MLNKYKNIKREEASLLLSLDFGGKKNNYVQSRKGGNKVIHIICKGDKACQFKATFDLEVYHRVLVKVFNFLCKYFNTREIYGQYEMKVCCPTHRIVPFKPINMV